ncbi:MAG: hypothetical protein AYK22_00965 [Thermoplasmatales archaeon SG8-52-3]|nr:MAG: hypothetical protein AYK22_00965 [Thermoplasmatales archaeon SG8-52-3]
MGDWKVKIKLFIPIVLVTIIFASTLAIAAKPSDLPDQAYNNGPSLDKQMARYFRLDEIAYRLWLEKGWVPEGLLMAMGSSGR